MKRYYIRDPKSGQLKNAPYVDNSCKWAGGGILSTTGDLLKFGNAMLFSYQQKKKEDCEEGYLKAETMRQLWEPVIRMAKDPKNLR